MASNFVPMHSSSPPPLDDCPDNDDEDDEFGTFSSATVAFDSSFDSPVSGEKFKPFKAGDNGVNDITLNNDINSLYANSPPQQKYTLNFSQNNCLKKPSKNEKQTEIAYESPPRENTPDSVSDISIKDSSATSQNLVPDGSLSDEEANNDSGSLESKEHSFCSIETKLQNSSKTNTSSDCDVNKVRISLFVPPSDNDVDNDIHIPCTNIDNSYHIDLPFNSENLSSINNEEINLEIPSYLLSDPAKRDNQTSKIFEHSLGDDVCSKNIDALDDFQIAPSLDNDVSELKLDSVGESEGFIANFDSEFANFQSFPVDVPSDDDFADFKNSCEESDFPGVQEEFEDFSDFKSCDKASCSSSMNNVNHCEASSTVCRKDSIKDEFVSNDEADDFDDFQGPASDNNFANFESAHKIEPSSPEFADFEGASFSSASSETFQQCSSGTSMQMQEKSTDKLSTVINTIFPQAQEECVVSDINYETPSEILEQSNKSRRLWEKLHEVEQAPGMRFHWGISHSFQQLLRSVNVDYHSILRTSSVPIFASSLSLLEPVKGLTNSANPESEDSAPIPKDPIPPVEFDWNSSGLINPLDSGQTSSILMDLSFLSSTETASSSVIGEDSFEYELLKPSPVPSFSETNSKTLILEELLSKNMCSSLPSTRVTHRPPHLSEEANSVLDQLSDLSFMRAKVLMFPLSNKI